MPRQLFYLSHASAALVDQDVRQILAISQRNNRQRDVTGCLLYTGKYFAQVLEGAPAPLDELIARIAKDTRHHDVVVAIDRTVEARQFANWSMGFLYRLDIADRLEAILAARSVSPETALSLMASIDVDSVMGSL